MRSRSLSLAGALAGLAEGLLLGFAQIQIAGQRSGAEQHGGQHKLAGHEPEDAGGEENTRYDVTIKIV